MTDNFDDTLPPPDIEDYIETLLTAISILTDVSDKDMAIIALILNENDDTLNEIN